MKKLPNMSKIFHIGCISIYIGHHTWVTKKVLPRFSYFNGGSYYKISLDWLHFIFEISSNKKDKNTYQKITREELDQILKKNF